MKVKDYLKKMENANEIMSLSCRNKYYEVEYIFHMENYSADKCNTFSSKTWKEFKKFAKKEFTAEFLEKILSQDFDLEKRYSVDGTTVKFSIG